MNSQVDYDRRARRVEFALGVAIMAATVLACYYAVVGWARLINWILS
jgi:hypothetical protein